MKCPKCSKELIWDDIKKEENFTYVGKNFKHVGYIHIVYVCKKCNHIISIGVFNPYT